jgi:hypothetical protein
MRYLMAICLAMIVVSSGCAGYKVKMLPVAKTPLFKVQLRSTGRATTTLPRYGYWYENNFREYHQKK